MKKIDRTPDSHATAAYALQVDDTQLIDHPEFGQVEIRIWHNERQSTAIHLSLTDARALSSRLVTYLNRKSHTEEEQCRTTDSIPTT